MIMGYGKSVLLQKWSVIHNEMLSLIPIAQSQC